MNREQNLNNAEHQQLNIAGVSGSSFYDVYCTDCLPRRFEVKDGQNINELVKAHIKLQNSGVPKSERIYLEKIVRL